MVLHLGCGCSIRQIWTFLCSSSTLLASSDSQMIRQWPGNFSLDPFWTIVILYGTQLELSELCLFTILSKHIHIAIKRDRTKNEKCANKTLSHHECQKPAAHVGSNSATIWISSAGMQSNSFTGYGIIWHFLEGNTNCWVNCHSSTADLKRCTNTLKQP